MKSASLKFVLLVCFSSAFIVLSVSGVGTARGTEESQSFTTGLLTDYVGNVSRKVGSCKDKCDTTGHSSIDNACQCNKQCLEHADCCDDYGTECLSCEGRCHFNFDRDFPCQCNTKCAKYKNCCDDHAQFCVKQQPSQGSTQSPNQNQHKAPVTDTELAQISETIFALEGPNNAAGSIRVNLGNRTFFNSSIDRSLTPLLTVQTNAYRKPTIAKLLPLHNNYVAAAATPEVVTSQETTEETQFLDEILATPIMRKTEDFLVNKGFILRQKREGGRLRNFPRAFRDALHQIWFGMYSREAGALGSSGFEHIFLGETKNNEVSGFHNWVFFSQEESRNNLNYYGHIRSLSLGNKGSVIKHNFQWLGARKPISTMFIGTSPELEMALYTICFYSRPGQRCPVVLGGKHINIQTHFISRQGKRYVGSSYPDI